VKAMPKKPLCNFCIITGNLIHTFLFVKKKIKM